MFKFQLLEMGQESPLIYGKQLYMHPVYKEIRNTTKTIFELWKGIGVFKNNVPMGEMPVIGNGGSPNYMEALLSNTKMDTEEKKAAEEAINKLPDDPCEDDTDEDIPEIHIKMKKGEKQAAQKGMMGKAKDLFSKIDEMGNEVRNNVKVAGEDEDGNPILVDADFDPTKLPEEDVQTALLNAMEDELYGNDDIQK